MAKRSRIALIDADSVLYAVACTAEMKASKQGNDGEDLWFQVKDEEQAYREVRDRLESLVDAVHAEDAIVALTTTKCFRYDLLPTYKANREGAHRPAVLGDLQRLVQERRPFGVVAVRGLEADDVVGIASGSLQEVGLREPIIVSIDKDMKQIPGPLYDPRHPEKGIQEVSGAEADRAHLYQTLIGDATDNYTGCPGVGPKRADKILDQCAHHSAALQWGFIEGAFLSRQFGAQYALTQARVARILRHDEWDPKAKVPLLWNPPAPE